MAKKDEVRIEAEAECRKQVAKAECREQEEGKKLLSDEELEQVAGGIISAGH